MYKYCPLFKTEYIFDPSIKIEKVIQAMHNSNTRVQWDKNVESITSISKIDRIELLKITNTTHKLISSKRDMFEKKFGFSHRPRINVEPFNDQMS